MSQPTSGTTEMINPVSSAYMSSLWLGNLSHRDSRLTSCLTGLPARSGPIGAPDGKPCGPASDLMHMSTARDECGHLVFLLEGGPLFSSLFSPHSSLLTPHFTPHFSVGHLLRGLWSKRSDNTRQQHRPRERKAVKAQQKGSALSRKTTG